MYHRRRKKMRHFIISAILLLGCSTALAKSVVSTKKPIDKYDNSFDNNIIDFDEDLSVKYNKNPWHTQEYFNKESHRYTIDNDFNKNKEKDKIIKRNETQAKLETSTLDYSVIPLDLTSTTESLTLSNLESTTEQDLTVIPLKKIPPTVDIKATIEPATTENVDITTYFTELTTFTTNNDIDTSATEFYNSNESSESTKASTVETTTDIFNTTESSDESDDKLQIVTKRNKENIKSLPIISGDKDEIKQNVTIMENNTKNETSELVKSTNITKVHQIKIKSTKAAKVSKFDDLSSELEDTDVPIFTELDTEEEVEVPEDYYDSKDVVPTTAPKTDALSIIFGLAGSVVESVVETVAEKVVPKGIVDLFRRMQRQSEALEAEKLRSREENGGIGQFGRGLLKSISTGLSVPLSQLMAGVRDIGSLDNDRGFVTSVASSVTSVAKQATEVLDAFKDKVHAIYPGTVWCGDGRSATARSSDLGLFFFTDTCCRQHDACKIYIRAGETKYGLTNTGLFTRSHCSCDAKFRDCLRRTNSLVSAQIGLTYFNVLGPQCFRKAHPIVKCVKKTRITGLKCEEYELDYSKPRMWQWFDNETF